MRTMRTCASHILLARHREHAALDELEARRLALATGAILMNDYGSGGSAVVAAGQAELGHTGTAAAASDIFLSHAPYPKGMPTTARAATVVFTGRISRKRKR